MVRVWRWLGCNVRRRIIRWRVQVIVGNETSSTILIMIFICTLKGKMRLVPVQYHCLGPSIWHDNIGIQRKHNVVFLAAQAIATDFWNGSCS